MVAGKALFVDMDAVRPLVRVGVCRQYSKRAVACYNPGITAPCVRPRYDYRPHIDHHDGAALSLSR